MAVFRQQAISHAEVPLGVASPYADEREVPRNAKSRFAPRSQEFIGAIPSVEAHAEAIRAKDAIEFRKREPRDRPRDAAHPVRRSVSPVPANGRNVLW